MLELTTFGGLELRTESGAPVDALADRTKCLALLAYLAAEASGRRVPREEAATALWSDRTDDRARASLRVALNRIRKATDPVLIDGEGKSTLAVVRDHVWADVTAFREAVEAGEHGRALELYRGDFLAGVRVEGATRFRRWADRRRGAYRREAYEAALSLGASAREAGDLASAEDAYRTALDLAPLREEAAAKLIRTLGDRGRPADAVQLFEAFRSRRRAQLDMGASAELEELVEELKRTPPAAPVGEDGVARGGGEGAAGGTGPAGDEDGPEAPGSDHDPGSTEPGRPGAPTGAERSPRPVLAGPLVALALAGAAAVAVWHLSGRAGGSPPTGQRSVAVLPFEAIGADRPGPVAEGLHDDLLTRLSKVSGLDVISATSVERFRDADLALPAVADSLGVRWIVEGEVQRSGDAVRVNVQLVDPHSDTHAWADTYRRELTAENLFEIQSRIAEEIVQSLESRITGERAPPSRHAPPGNLAAYRHYVQGRALLERRTAPEVRRAADHFRRAIEEDSTYALAWAGLADALSLSIDTAGANRDSLIATAGDAARRALDLGEDLAEAHAAMGRVHVYREEGREALRELARAVELRPSYASAHAWLGKLQMTLGRPEAALGHVERSVRLDPASPENRQILVWARLADGDPAAALEAARRTAELQPRLVPRAGPEMFALYHLGRFDEIRERARAAGDSAHERPLVALAAARAGDRGPARRLLARVDEASAPMTAALLNAAVGETARVYDALERAMAEPSGGIWNHAIIAARHLFPDLLGPLRDDPRFQELLRQVNRRWGLRPDGSLPGEARDSAV